jgi:hypothetical protein
VGRVLVNHLCVNRLRGKVKVHGFVECSAFHVPYGVQLENPITIMIRSQPGRTDFAKRKPAIALKPRKSTRLEAERRVSIDWIFLKSEIIDVGYRELPADKAKG